MITEELVDRFIEALPTQMSLFQIMLLRYMLINDIETIHYSRIMNGPSYGLKIKSKFYDEFIGKELTKDGKNKK